MAPLYAELCPDWFPFGQAPSSDVPRRLRLGLAGPWTAEKRTMICAALEEAGAVCFGAANVAPRDDYITPISEYRKFSESSLATAFVDGARVNVTASDLRVSHLHSWDFFPYLEHFAALDPNVTSQRGVFLDAILCGHLIQVNDPRFSNLFIRHDIAYRPTTMTRFFVLSAFMATRTFTESSVFFSWTIWGARTSPQQRSVKQSNDW